jgi:hypothetical protein
MPGGIEIGLADLVRAAGRLQPDPEALGKIAALVGYSPQRQKPLLVESRDGTESIERVVDQPREQREIAELRPWSDVVKRPRSMPSRVWVESDVATTRDRVCIAYDDRDGDAGEFGSRLQRRLGSAVEDAASKLGLALSEMPQVDLVSKIDRIHVNSIARNVVIVLVPSRLFTPSEADRLSIALNQEVLVIPVMTDRKRRVPPPPLKGIKGLEVFNRKDDRELDRLETAVLGRLELRVPAQMRRVHLSYRKSDGEIPARRIRELLERRGFEVHGDFSESPNPDSVLPRHVTEDLTEAIRGSSFLLVIDTPQAPESAWINEEVKLAVELRVPILPIVIADARLQAAREVIGPGGRFLVLRELQRQVPRDRPLPPEALFEQTVESVIDERFIDELHRELILLLRAHARSKAPFPPDIVPLPLPPESEQPLLPLQPLLEPQWARAVLSTALATRSYEGTPDVRAVVDALCRLQPVNEFPRRARPTLRRGVQVLVDLGRGLLPYARDQVALVTELRRVVGESAVQVLRFAGCPSRNSGAGPRPTWGTYIPPPPGTPALVVTDFGIARPPLSDDAADIEEWLEWANQVKRAGCPVVALVPYDLSRCPAALEASMTIFPWDRRTSVTVVRRSISRSGLGAP